LRAFNSIDTGSKGYLNANDLAKFADANPKDTEKVIEELN